MTFGLLTAGSLGVRLDLDVDPAEYDRLDLQLRHISSQLQKRRGVLGKALSLLTEAPQVRNGLHAYLEVLLAVGHRGRLGQDPRRRHPHRMAALL